MPDGRGKRVSISVRVPAGVASALARAAEANDRSVSAEIRRALRHHVETIEREEASVPGVG